ncbi:C6 transcription factor, putative [Aspergillus fumigatus A1163]|uniref:C6 transcription factor, putative n=2 Tax=Aspergillus fumigatus TaxID=746128 RepID=Q4WDJ9_ASPFU|nr:C6 transcription factor, putative [Aspergillus fumigatus Af293]EAL85539.1 C6 transcription factor, putative [Aspergillus fumigatus Af293]EDP47484.1 C6 transcription factor, putative [Aspergillus fumigatus A1163]
MNPSPTNAVKKTPCSLSQPCRACSQMGFECLFLQPQKKRGPTGNRVSQIRQQQQTQLLRKSSQSSLSDAYPYQRPITSRETGQHGVAPSVQDPTQWPIPQRGEASVSTDVVPPRSNTSIGPSWPATDTSSVDSQTNSAISWNERSDVEYWLPDNLDAQVPVFEFPGSNIYLKASLPSIIQPEQEAAGLQPHHVDTSNLALSTMGVMPAGPVPTRTTWPASIVEANMIPWIEVYFDRLHPTLPVLNRSSLFIRMLAQEHRRNPQFGAMLLSLCAFSLTQPIEIDERPTSSSRASQARSMMNEATKMRSCSDFGEHPTIEAVLTSFFLFGCLFGSNQHNAAWLRLREALDLAATLGLNNPDSYRDIPNDERGQRLRTYLVLSITERAYALQRRHPITFWGRPGFTMRSVHDFIHNATHSVVSGIIVHNEKDAEGMLGLARLMELFDAIDEEVVDCWNQRCNVNSGYCNNLTEEKALSIHQNLRRVCESERYKGYDWFERTKSVPGEVQSVQPTISMRETQCADVFITKKWLQNRVWVLCSTHGLLRPVSDHPELSFEYAITVAVDALKICQSLRLSSMEAHGIGLVEKLYDIAVSAIGISANVRQPLGEHSTASVAGSMAGPGVAPPGSLVGAMSPNTAAVHSTQSLAEDFMLLLNTLRGGNHPFMEKFKAYLSSLHIVGVGCSNWAQT